MKTVWTKGLDADMKKEMSLHFNSSAQLRKRLGIILSEKIQSKEKEIMNNEAYDNVNWAYKQADAQGYKRAMTEIASILK